jgi:hypothetical protein
MFYLTEKVTSKAIKLILEKKRSSLFYKNIALISKITQKIKVRHETLYEILKRKNGFFRRTILS